jgi:hypothetical protein
MQDENRIVYIAFGIAVSRTKRRLMDAQTRKRLSVAKSIVFKPGIDLRRG